MLNRRNILTALGASLGMGKSTLALAAKGITDSNILAATGTVVGGSYLGGMPDVGGDFRDKCIRAADLMKFTGIPEVIDKQLRNSAKWCGQLDYDIASKRSWSMSVKFQEQRQRNYQRQRDELLNAGWVYRKRKLLAGVLGFEWPL